MTAATFIVVCYSL